MSVSTSAIILPFYSQTEYKENQTCKHEKRIFSAKKNFVSTNVFVEEDWYALDVDTGEIGPQGIPGPIGPEGKEGKQGSNGFAGLEGKQGPPGAPGAQGERGPSGLQGAPGISGATGLTGPAGPIGPPGPTGPAGAVGAEGLRGAQGEKGAQGVPGTQGEKGIAGEKGLIGPPGQIGPAGLTGPRGEEGKPGQEYKEEVLGEIASKVVELNLAEGRRLFVGTLKEAETEFKFKNAPVSPHYAEVTCILKQGVGGNKKFKFTGAQWVNKEPVWVYTENSLSFVNFLVYSEGKSIIGWGE